MHWLVDNRLSNKISNGQLQLFLRGCSGMVEGKSHGLHVVTLHFTKHDFNKVSHFSKIY